VSLLALLVPVGADWYALDMASVREVVAFPLLTRVPTAPAALLGLFNLRGEIVPLFDTAALLDAGRMAGVASFAVVVLTDLGPAALTATGAPEAAELDQPLPTETVAGLAAYGIGNRLATLVEVGDLLSPERLGSAGVVTAPAPPPLGAR